MQSRAVVSTVNQKNEFKVLSFFKKVLKNNFLLLVSLLFISLLFYTKIELYFNNSGVPTIELSENYPGGDGSVSFTPFPSFMLPMENLESQKKSDFHAGKALARQPWIKAPTVTFARDGLGPVFNARTCLMCHVNGGRGVMPVAGDVRLDTAFLRLSIPGFDAVHGVVAEPMYGDQLQTQSTSLAHMFRHLKDADLKHSVAPEAYIFPNWSESSFTYPDGTKINLREPDVKITNLGYGKMHPDTMMGLRNAPPLLGVGLLENIRQKDINRLVDEDDSNSDGISGRLNMVWDFEKNKTVPGRFGLKSNKASVRLQTAGALNGDMGISNPIFREQPCTEKQKECLNQVTGIDFHGDEISEELMGLMIDFTRTLGVPKRRNPNSDKVISGRALFYETGCAECHHPSYTTGKNKEYPHLANQTIWPYTDLLLHDMGEGLADGRPDYLATGSEWRTPPLWGVGLSGRVNGANNFLHDGRARNIEEAIIWHGGEAEQTKQKFVSLDKMQRENLIEFVNSL